MPLTLLLVLMLPVAVPATRPTSAPASEIAGQISRMPREQLEKWALSIFRQWKTNEKRTSELERELADVMSKYAELEARCSQAKAAQPVKKNAGMLSASELAGVWKAPQPNPVLPGASIGTMVMTLGK